MGNNIFIRPSMESDVPDILGIILSAKKFMRKNNNHSQWSDDYPGETDILKDIEKGYSFVGCVDDEPVMTFAFILGDDPTYLRIREGKWLNEEKYGTIHRIASNGKIGGVLKTACEFCFKQTGNIRIDTHEDNGPMLTALERLGFVKCGVINCRDGSPRIAFQKKL